jgi:hypothetical protein
VINRSPIRTSLSVFLLLSLFTMSALAAPPAKSSSNFTNTPLLRPDGASEPEIRIDSSGNMAMVSLSWEKFVSHMWSGPFGSTPVFRGEVDSALQVSGPRNVYGGGDADIDIGATGTVHASTLIFITPPTNASYTLGVSAISCRNGLSTSVAIPGGCTSKVIDTAGADRQWITSDGSRVWISYHDGGNSSLIHVQRSDDDGFTWNKVASPVPGQGSTTGNTTFNNDQGNIVADHFTHNLYDIWAAGQSSVQKGTSANFNNIYVSRSSDGGLTWNATLVYSAPLFTALNNVFPALAADPANGNLYAVWSDAHSVYLSASTNQGQTWSPAEIVSASPAVTAVFPWVAAQNGTVDVVYYGTTASSKDDTTAVWNVYMAQATNGGSTFTQTKVSDTANHVGPICTGGTSCAAGTRNLLDLFQVAIDPQNTKAAIIYTSDTVSTDSNGNPLPQAVLAQQN